MNLKLIQDRFDHDKRNIEIEQDKIIEFALEYFRTNEKARWNGRQIRNACQTALALAEFKAQGGNHDIVLDPNADVSLAVDNFKTVSKAYLEFTKYLKQLYGLHEDVRANELGLRALETRWQPQHQSTQSPAFGGNITQSGSNYGNAPPYRSASLNPVQTVYSQPYQPTSMMGTVHMNPGIVTQHPGQQTAYYSNPVQVGPPDNLNTFEASGQVQSGQMPHHGQTFGGMQFHPAHGNINQQSQPGLGQAGPPKVAGVSPPPPAQGQQQYQALFQQVPGTEHLESKIPTSQMSQTRQFMPPQQSTQQQAQTWYPNMNVQTLQPSGGQNPLGSSH